MATTDTTSTAKKGDIRIAFGFERVEGYGLPEPVIYLYTHWNKQVMVNVPACMMHEFDERDRDPFTKEPLCIPKCEQIAEMLYGMPTSYGAHRVLDALTEFATDLKDMPPPSTFRDPSQLQAEMRRRGYDLVG